MEAENVPERARQAGEKLATGLAALPNVRAVRGEGLLLAAELTGEFAPAACRAALDAGLVVNAPRPDSLRLAPPLLVTDGEIDEALSVLGSVLAATPTSATPTAADPTTTPATPTTPTTPTTPEAKHQ
jgi:acetylornithine/succinyldiaminopimelate/putrescine aminotransferase